MTYQKVVKSLWQKFSPQSVEMSSHTWLSDRCNSVPRFPSVIHSEPLLNILVARSQSCWLRCRRHLQVQLSEIGRRMTLFTTENETVWLRPEPVILSTSIQTSHCCRSCSWWITSKQTSNGNIEWERWTSVRFWQQWRGTINIKQPYIRDSGCLWNKTSWFIINISKQQAFETKNLAGLWR